MKEEANFTKNKLATMVRAISFTEWEKIMGQSNMKKVGQTIDMLVSYWPEKCEYLSSGPLLRSIQLRHGAIANTKTRE